MISSTALLSCGVIGVCLTLFALGWLLNEPAATGQPPPEPTTYEVTLVCQDCLDEGIEINLWATAERDDMRVVGNVPHNTRATVLDTALADGMMRYQVEAGGMVGWVSELFIQR